MQRYCGRIGLAFLMVLLGVGASRVGWKALRSMGDAQAGKPAALVWPPALAPASDSFCHTAKLTLGQLDKAQEEGLAVDQNRRCITRAAMKAHEDYLAERAAYQERKAQDDARKSLERKLQAELEQAVAQQVEQGGITLSSLAQARSGKSTQVGAALLPGTRATPQPLLTPPADLFVPITYRSGSLDLAGFVTPSPKDGKRHPAIIWLTGGDTNTLGDFWKEGASQDDQSASAFRKAGMVMLFPSLRGGNTNPGQHEYFWGEVDDVIAAVLFAAKLPYVDPSRIYIGGHSTGGTLALLVASTGLPVQGIFAFGPVADATRYTAAMVPVRWQALAPEETQLRAPKNWLHAVKSPTWIIEGAQPPGNVSDLQALCMARKSDQVRCVQVPGHDHFSVLQPLTRRIAAQIVMGEQPKLESSPLQ